MKNFPKHSMKAFLGRQKEKNTPGVTNSIQEVNETHMLDYINFYS
jgi:hypothetical protein